uniref:Uncharacterized protein n=1 Tax=Trichobilharzia regenti TaxID=157069 RepID=A0AA85K3Z7_TRIRE|nr:unnamed protein product [Trichobilharzia regenti]
MKLSDLKINRKPLDRSKTKEIISKVSSFLEESKNTDAECIEGEAEDGRYIELNLLIPTSNGNEESLILPVNFSGSSTECDDSSSESENDLPEITIQSTGKLNTSIPTPPSRKSAKLIEEIEPNCTDDCDIKK